MRSRESGGSPEKREALPPEAGFRRQAAGISPRVAKALARARAENQDPTGALGGLTTRLPGQRTFEVEPAGDGPVTWVTPALEPATLEVAAPAHGQVRVPVLARFFPAHTVHARRSTAVVAASHCRLKSTDHYHVHRVTVGFDELLGEGRGALRNLFQDRSDAGIARFQQAMKRIADRPRQGGTRASVPVREDAHTLITSSKAVQLGDRSRMNVNTHYVVEESRLPVADLLARDKDLVRSFLAAVDGPERGPETRKFLSAALGRAGRADDLSVLSHGSGLSAPDTSISWIFGVDRVAWASAVMVGSDNDLLTSMRVERGRLSPGRIRNELGRVRQYAPKAPDPASRAPGPTRRNDPGLAPPGAAPPSPFGFSIRGPRPSQRGGRGGRAGPGGRAGRGGLW